VRHWDGMRERASRLSTLELRDQLHNSARLRRKLDLFDAAAQTALLPDSQSEILLPDQCDWAWRPDPWGIKRAGTGVVGVPSPYRMSDEVSLFHDCQQSEITLRQFRNHGGDIAAPFGVSMDVYRFDGSFMSLVFTLPDAALRGLGRDHFFSMRLRALSEQPIEIYARLNVQHGPNTEQMVREVAMSDGAGKAEFDLAYTNINERRIGKVWLDLIFEGPAMNQIRMFDVTLTRAPRASL